MKILDDEKDKLLDHDYDGIRELDNHMPVWWLWMFYVSIVFAAGYLLYYEVFRWGPDQHEEYENEIAAAEVRYATPEDASPETFVWEIRESEADIAAGKELFGNAAQLCFTCHGGEAQGMVGPNLTDEYWLHGCTPEEIAESIIQGIPEKGMLPYGSGTKLSNEDVLNLVSYIASIQGSDPAGAKQPDTDRAVRCMDGPLASTES